jgi:hypothetical protein
MATKFKPQIILGGDTGAHNLDLEAANERLRKGRAYEDLSTVCVCPTRGQIAARVVESWMGMIRPMNQPFVGPMFVQGMEVADAYNVAIETILAHDQIKGFRYLLTLEEDNMPQPDGLLKLYESVKDYDVVGGLYWTKGLLGQPMIYGRPGQVPAFAPQMIKEDEFGTTIRCNGLGMGFTLFRMDIFRKTDGPWFKTVQEWKPNEGASAMTQDLYFFENARKAGLKVGCDVRVQVGHYDSREDRVW